MELSINAIILIVIALTVLGFGLGITNGVLSLGGDVLAQSVEGYRLEIPASSTIPIVVSDPLRIRQGQPTVVFTNIYNRNTLSCDDSQLPSGLWLYLDCPDIDFSRIQTQVIDIPLSQQRAVGMVVDTSREVTKGKYPCTIRVYCENRDDRVDDGIVTDDPAVRTIESKSLFVEVI